MSKEILQPLLHERFEQVNSEHPAVSRGRTNFSCNGDVCGLSGVETRPEEVQARSAAIRKLCIATGLCLVFMAVEVAGGMIANSLAVLTDAAHLLSDVASFAISLFAIWAASWEATPRQTYGFFRLEILGALVSIQIIWLLTGILVYEAIYRICHTSQQVDGRLMFIVASFGFCVNLVMLLLLGHHGHSHGSNHDHGHHHDQNDDHHHDRNDDHDHDHVEASGNDGLNEEPRAIHFSHSGHHDAGHEHTRHPDELDITIRHGHQKCQGMNPHEQSKVNWDVEKGSTSQGCANENNINVQGAYLHALGDLIQSIGVMIGGAVIWVKPNWKVVDLICTLLFSLLVLYTTIKMLREIVEILMESTPRGIDSNSLTEGLLNISGVTAVHELHIWSITMGKTLLACHIMIDSDADADAILKEALHFCENDFKISHVTVQIERNC